MIIMNGPKISRLGMKCFLIGLWLMRNSDWGSTFWWWSLKIIRLSFDIDPALKQAAREMVAL